jgi:hypothetical protein
MPQSATLRKGPNRTAQEKEGKYLTFALAQEEYDLEISKWNARYKGSGDADDTRIQTSFIYKFRQIKCGK